MFTKPRVIALKPFSNQIREYLNVDYELRDELNAMGMLNTTKLAFAFVRKVYEEPLHLCLGELGQYIPDSYEALDITVPVWVIDRLMDSPALNQWAEAMERDMNNDWDLYCCRFSSSGDVEVTNHGDFRINQWSEEHIHEGIYSPYPRRQK